MNESTIQRCPDCRDSFMTRNKDEHKKSCPALNWVRCEKCGKQTPKNFAKDHPNHCKG